MDFEPIGSVLEGVVDAMDGAWEFAGLSDGDEACREGLRDGDAEDEPAAFGADDEVDAFAAVRVCHEFDREGQRAGVSEQRREIFEEDAGLREVWNVADETGQIVHAERISRVRGLGLWCWQSDRKRVVLGLLFGYGRATHEEVGV